MKSRTEILYQTQKLLTPLRFRYGQPDLDKLKLFAEEGFPVEGKMTNEERKRFEAMLDNSDKAVPTLSSSRLAAAGKSRTTQLYIPDPFIQGSFNNVEQLAHEARRHGRRSIRASKAAKRATPQSAAATA